MIELKEISHLFPMSTIFSQKTNVFSQIVHPSLRIKDPPLIINLAPPNILILLPFNLIIPLFSSLVTDLLLHVIGLW